MALRRGARHLLHRHHAANQLATAHVFKLYRCVADVEVLVQHVIELDILSHRQRRGVLSAVEEDRRPADAQ